MLQLAKDQDELLLEWILRMPDEKADGLLVDVVSHEMRKRLREKREDGKAGWFGPIFNNAYLKRLLAEHINDNDMIDVINIAAMIMVRKKLYGESA